MLDFLYGTAWKEELTKDCVIQAISAGYRGIDTANQRKHYNEQGVGEALLHCYQNTNIKREQLYLQSKFTYVQGQDDRIPYNPHDSYAKQVRDSFNSTLKNLHTEYLDSYILHGPFSNRLITYEDKQVWKEMENIFKEGKVKSIGVSNVSLDQLEELYHFAEIKPKTAQIRCFARNRWEKSMREFCKAKNITFQGFSLLTANKDYIGANFHKAISESVPKLIFNKMDCQPRIIGKISEQTGMTPAQIIFKFCHQLGILPITGTTDPNNMSSNLNIAHRRLTNTHLDYIENLAFNSPSES